MPVAFDLPAPIANVLSYIGFSKEPEPVPPPEMIDVPKAVRWLSDCAAIKQKLDQLTPNGLYSLLDKQIEVATPLLGTGQKISQGQACSPFVGKDLRTVKTRLVELQRSLEIAELQNAPEHAKDKEDDETITMTKSGKTRTYLPLFSKNHADCARFLMEGKLAFSIVGYREIAGDLRCP